MKKYKTAFILFLVFETIAVTLWLTSGNLFFLLNFSYIGMMQCTTHICGMAKQPSNAPRIYARSICSPAEASA